MGLLDGIKVVEAASYITAPLAGTMLADMGAQVTKVEPAGGDPFRRFGRMHNGLSIVFANANRGKKSVLLDLKDPAGMAELKSLLGGADVFLSNWRPRVAAGLGLSDDVVRSLNPRLVWVRISGFGPSGPLSEQPAFDTILQARSGLTFTQGSDDGPELIRAYFVDKITATMATQTVLAALVSRQSTSTGSTIDLAMLDAVAYFNFPDMMVERTLIDGPASESVNRQMQAPRPLPTADGWLVVSPVSGKQLAGALAAVGHPEWKAKLKAIDDPVEMSRTIYSLLETATITRPTVHWLQAFTEHDVPVAPVLDIDAHLGDPQVAHNGTYAELDHPELGRIRAPRHPGRVKAFDHPAR